MKDSGIDWIGQIPENWEVRRIKSLCDYITRGATPKYVEKSDYKVMNQATFSKGYVDEDRVRYSDGMDLYSLILKNDLLMASTGKGVLGKLLYYNEVADNFYADSHVTILRSSNETTSTKFLYYALYTKYDLINKTMTRGSTNQTELQRDYLVNYLLPIPPLQEQQKIAEFLDRKCGEVDEMVALQEKMVEELKAYKQSIISEAVTKGLNPNAPTKDSGIEWIGLIPENWEVSRIASFFTGDVDLNSDFHYQHAYKFYYGTLVPKNEQGNIEQYKETYIKYSVIKANDILLNGLNLNYDFVSQRVAIAPNDGIITSAYIVLRPRESTFAPYFNYLFKAMDNQKLFHGMGKGIRLTLNFDELKRQLIPVPPLQEQQQIADYLDKKCSEIDKLISLKQQKIEALKEYKNSIISEYTTGKKSIA